MKKPLAVALSVCIVGIPGYFAYRAVMIKGPEESARSYIEAVKARDFTTVFALNHRTQKRMNIFERAEESDKQGLVKKLYDGSERAFKAMQPTDDTTLTWAEKFFFIPEMDYRILGAKKETTSSTPSSDYRSKRVATVLVAVSYPNSGTAPVYRERKLREARLRISMIQSRDVVKGIQTEPAKEGWLYQWLQVDDENIVYTGS
jgi:hypothetical protein